MSFLKTYKQYWYNHKWLMVSLHVMFCSLFLTEFMIGNKPVLCKYKNEWHVLIFHAKPEDGSQLLFDLSSIAQFDYHKLNYDLVIWPWVNLNPKAMEPESAWLAPFSKKQNAQYFLLGSYDLGRDVLTGCIYGLHKSLLLAILAIFFSGLVGIFIGSVFSFQSQRFNQVSVISMLFYILFICVFLYTIVLFIEWKHFSWMLWMYLILFLLILLISGIYFTNKTPQLIFKMDFIGLRYIEIMKSIPMILILLILLQIFKNPDVFGFACLISIVYIPIVAKYARVFTLSASNETYINSIIVIGQTPVRIYWKHILPRLISELIPILAFGVANIILLEASLSFLGLGFPLDEIDLGTMMFSARSFPSAWWVVVFPGLLVFWLVATFNALGELWSDKKSVRDYQA